MQVLLLLSFLLLMTFTIVTARPLSMVEYDNDIEELVDGRDFNEILKLMQKLNVEDDIKQIYLKVDRI